MRFLAFSPLAAYALLAGTAAAIVFIYWRMRVPAQRVVTPSLLVWTRLLAARRRTAARWRWLLSVAAALAIGLSIALALTRPELPAVGAFGQRVVVILDTSPSMAARTADGRSRLEHALAQARRLVERAGAGGEVMVLDTSGQTGAAGFASRADALARLSRLSAGAQPAIQVPPVPGAGAAAAVHLFTDGVAPASVPEGIEVHSVFEPADNVAITAFEARALPGDPGRWQAFVQLHNASQRAMPAILTVSAAGRVLWHRALALQPGETADETLDVSAFAGGAMRAEVAAPGDAFDRDDVAYTVVPPHAARRVLLVTPGDGVLEDALRALPGVALTVVGPAAYSGAPAADAYVFDRFAPQEPPAAGALLLGPPPVPWLPVASIRAGATAVARWDEASPLTAGVAWHELRAKRAALVPAQESVSIVVTAQGAAPGGLIATGSARAPWIQVGFAREDANFHLQAGYPVFLGNALAWLGERAAPVVRALGTIEVPIGNASVRDADGRPVPSVRTPGGTAFEAARPGLYAVDGARGQMQVVAAVLDPRFAQINRSRLADQPAGGVRAARGSARRWPDPWVALLVVAAALLLAEWVAYTRRLTV